MQFDQAKIRMPAKQTLSSKGRVSAFSEGFKGEYYKLPTGDLIPYHNQARKIFDPEEIAGLAESIKLYGIRQPLTVIKSKDEHRKYEIISGERRYRAAVSIGLEKVPCIILQEEAQAEEIALVENTQRVDLHPIELMNAFVSLIDKGICKTQAEIASKIGVSRSVVAEVMRLQQIPKETQLKLLESNIRTQKELRDELKRIKKLEAVFKPGRAKAQIILTAKILQNRCTITSKIKELSEEQKLALKLQLEKLLDSLES